MPNRDIPPMPSWETIVEMMKDKGLDAFSDEVIEVLFWQQSGNKTPPR